uniref:Putative S-adenosylmethionine-dependent methyltransferase At5g37990 n=1 Tax=Rhizophora mucronata TaxID=61149 RepID=A0A2P2IKR8_RHIMU
MAESFAMNGGDGPFSYVRNSDMQRRAADAAKALLVEQIVENLEMGNAAPSVFTIADMGCSTGPNTFSAVDTIIEAVTKKYEIEGQSNHLPEFQVAFNDRVSNDFNTLFANLPSDKKYYAAGVPGSFHGRLFPKASLSFVYSAIALHWLSEAPQEIGDLGSPACNRGRFFYDNAPKQIVEAYFSKFAKDMEFFLRARAEEVTAGGLMAILISGCPSGTLPSQCSPGLLLRPLESCLLDMANEGIISNDKVDSFNLPLYCPSIDELTTLIQNNGCFSVLRMEMLPNRSNDLSLLSTEMCRAAFENLIRGHFGGEIIEQLFQRYTMKIVGHPLPRTSETAGIMFVLLKRKA